MLGLMGLATPANTGPNCKCRAYGQEFAQGQVLCIQGKLARCGMNLNISSWNIIYDSCPQTKLSPTPVLPHSVPPNHKEI
ncbi:MAG: hypothetical protein ACREDN_07740 [Aestuariivirga sp.]